METDKIFYDLESISSKTKNVTFDEYVSMGKALLNTIECYQARIAFYACKVCTIRHGGISGGLYTIKDFAKAIGLNPHTVSNWTLIYRNVLMRLDVDIKDVDKETWARAGRTNEMLLWHNRRDNIAKGTPKGNSQFKDVISLNDLKKVYKDESDDSPNFNSELRRWISFNMMVKNNLKKRDLNIADDCDLLELMNYLDESSEIINNFLTQKKRKRK
jgi:hypothetical protein